MWFQACCLRTKTCLYIKKCIRLRASKIIVLMGLKLHNALYPSIEVLLAEAIGISTMIASKKWVMAKIRWVIDFLVFMFFSFWISFLFSVSLTNLRMQIQKILSASIKFIVFHSVEYDLPISKGSPENTIGGATHEALLDQNIQLFWLRSFPNDRFHGECQPDLTIRTNYLPVHRQL